MAGVGWSPTNTQLVVVSTQTTLERDTFTISLVNVESGDQRDIGIFNLNYYPIFDGYVPSWSFDEQYLAIQGEDEPILYNLVNNATDPLDSRLEGPLYWSPIASYTENQCN